MIKLLFLFATCLFAGAFAGECGSDSDCGYGYCDDGSCVCYFGVVNGRRAHDLCSDFSCDADNQCGHGLCEDNVCVCDDQYVNRYPHELEGENYNELVCSYKQKRTLVAFLLQLFLGLLGTAQFYLGNIGLGCGQLILFVASWVAFGFEEYAAPTTY